MNLFSRIAQVARSSAMTGEELAERLQLCDTRTGAITNSGEFVTVNSAMQLAAVYACIQVLTKTFAATPVFLLRSMEGGGREKARRHPLYRVLKESAMEHESAFKWRENSMLDLLTDGNAFSQIMRNRLGQVVGLNYLAANRVTVNLSPITGEISYQAVDDNGILYDVPRREMFHVTGMLVVNGRGLSPIAVARETIGKGLAATRYGANFFAGGGQIDGIVSLNDGQVVNDEGWERFKKEWRDEYESGSPSNERNHTAFLSAGVSYARLSITPEEAQFLETIKATTREICGIFGVPPHMIGDLERATFSNIEEQSIEFIRNTMIPHYTRFESAIDTQLLSENEKKQGYYSKFNANHWMRGDMKTRSAYYQAMRQNGILNADEIRELEDMNPQDGPQGKTYFINSAMKDAKDDGKEPNEVIEVVKEDREGGEKSEQ